MALIATITDIETLVDMLVKHKLDYIEVEGVKIQKLKHEPNLTLDPLLAAYKKAEAINAENPDESLFWPSDMQQG